jgi:nitroreductase
MPLGEAIFTQRSIRRFKPDPIPLADVQLILEAASKAPNGGNQQVARFLVLNDRVAIREFGALYHEAWWAKAARRGVPPEGGSPAHVPCRGRTGRRDDGRALHRLRVGAP